jgi:hypothetical protein
MRWSASLRNFLGSLALSGLLLSEAVAADPLLSAAPTTSSARGTLAPVESFGVPDPFAEEARRMGAGSSRRAAEELYWVHAGGADPAALPPSVVPPMADVVNDPVYSRTYYGVLESLFYQNGYGAASRPAVISNCTTNNNIPGSTAIATGDVNNAMLFGPRLTLGMIDHECCTGWEGGYFGLFGGQGSTTAICTGDLALPGALGLASINFQNSDMMTLTTSNQLQSVEWNRVRYFGDWSVLVGLRYINYQEYLNIHSPDGADSYGDYHINTANNMLGPQLGLRREITWGRVGWYATGKTGLLANANSQTQSVTDFPTPNPVTYLRPPVYDRRNVASFLGELNAGMLLPISRNWTARVGYNMLFLEGLALAADQLDFTYISPSFPGTTSSSVVSSGGVLLHGASLGLEGRW